MFNYQLPTTNNLVVKLAHFVIASKYLLAYKAPVFCPLPSVLCLLPSVICLLSSVFRIFTTVESALQISSFMRNKPNFRKSQMNVTSLITVDYENKSNWTLGENKPNSKPIKANTKPIKANTMPKQSQYKPNQTQFQRRRTGERYKKTPELVKEMMEKVPVYKACKVVLSDVALDWS